MHSPIAVDAMGGDGAPDVIVQGAVDCHCDGIPVVLVGDEPSIRAAIPVGIDVPVVHASEVVAMEDSPASLRRRPEVSVRVAMRLVADGKAGGVVSCGNSGATLVATLIDLGMIEGVDRPAICTVVPTRTGGKLVLLDAGATVDCKPEQLVLFAQLGASYARALGMSNPRVGLLSIGEEDGKGNGLVKATAPMLRALSLNVVGNIEPHHAHAGACDVLVTDGFMGNVFLKSAEGAAATMAGVLREELHRSAWTRIGGWFLRGAFSRLRHRLSWDAHGGALLIGANGVVVVGHGRANASAVRAAVRLAHYSSASKVVDAVTRGLCHQDE